MGRLKRIKNDYDIDFETDDERCEDCEEYMDDCRCGPEFQGDDDDE